MRSYFARSALLAIGCLLLSAAPALADPDETVRTADQVLHEVMAIPARQIPAALLAEAHGVAIVPGVIKVGFIAGIRRGRGVVLARGPDGQWSLPQFVTLTGGSVGWQAGVQGTDVVLVFMTKKSVEGLMNGKFTIGADASAAAGPVGRNAAAATDVGLRAEILSYSRSRGLFLGLALDGTAIEIDANAHAAYYGAAPAQPPQRIPESAAKLQQDVLQLTHGGQAEILTPTEAQVPTEAATHAPAARERLAESSVQLQATVDEPWRKYLALPNEVFEGNNPPKLESMQRALQQYDRVAQSPKYKSLTQRAEFQSTHQLLRAYTRDLSEAARRQLALPPPPAR